MKEDGPTMHGEEARVPMHLPLHSWIKAFRGALASAVETDNALRCAGVAFFAFLSIFPAMAAGVSLFGLFVDPTQISASGTFFAEFLPVEIMQIIEGQLASFVARDSTFGLSLVISLLIAAWTGTRGINALIHAVNVAYMETDERGLLRSLWLSISATLVAIIILVTAVTAIAILPAFLTLVPVPQAAEVLSRALRWPIIALVIMGGLVLLFRATPHRRSPKTRWVIPGALIATILWLIGSYLISLYIENFGRYEATFGSIAAAAIFMLWLNFTATVIVFGAAVNAQLEWITHSDTTVGDPKPMGERGAYVADTLSEK
ncbi:MAG: YihY/virulence factor BrkB family protein [Ahrensia sp.]